MDSHLYLGLDDAGAVRGSFSVPGTDLPRIMALLQDNNPIHTERARECSNNTLKAPILPGVLLSYFALQTASAAYELSAGNADAFSELAFRRQKTLFSNPLYVDTEIELKPVVEKDAASGIIHVRLVARLDEKLLFESSVEFDAAARPETYVPSVISSGDATPLTLSSLAVAGDVSTFYSSLGRNPHAPADSSGASYALMHAVPALIAAREPMRILQHKLGDPQTEFSIVEHMVAAMGPPCSADGYLPRNRLYVQPPPALDARWKEVEMALFGSIGEKTRQDYQLGFRLRRVPKKIPFAARSVSSAR